MGYVDDTLAPSERIVRRAAFHWLYSLGAWLGFVFMLAAGVIVYLGGMLLTARLDTGAGPEVPRLILGAVAAVFAAIGLWHFLRQMLDKWTTEIAVTDRRLVYKTGWISRRTQEMPVAKLEEVNLRQTVLGRLFGYGRLAISGTGGDTALILPEIDDPIAFRRAIAEARDGQPQSEA
jgi:membrane protein YdbS with pleckstrin-like domain